MPGFEFNIGRDPDAPVRTRRALDQITSLLNSLLRNGDIEAVPGPQFRVRRDPSPPPGGAGFGAGEGDSEFAFLPGPPGVAGPTGATSPFIQVDPVEGEPGSPGPAGADGAIGPTGTGGPAGMSVPFFHVDPAEPETGPPGPAGANGAAGATGSTGSTGPSGAAYPFFQVDPADGEPGFPGPSGADGAAGSQGSQGATGPQIPFFGQDEPDPMPGPPGLNGAAGVQGPTGPGIPFFTTDAPEPDPSVSVPGPQGVQGAIGPTGAGIPFFTIDAPEPDPSVSVPGPTGVTGSTGPTGATGPAMNINPIINGNFDVWQRATSFTSIADGKYFADRWKYKKVGAVVHDASRSVDTPTPTQSGVYSKYGVQLVVTTVDASIAAGDYCHIKQHIEGYWYALFAQMQFTLSFWVKSKLTGTYCVFFQNKDTADRSYVAEYTIDVADTWEFKTVTVTAPPSAGTWDYESGQGLTVGFSQSCGSTFQTTAGAWQTGNFFGTSNQVNNTATGGGNGYFFLSQVMLVVGATGAPLLQRSYGPELALCQRYATYIPAQPIGVAVSTNSLYNQGAITWPVTMRATPALGVLPAAAYTANAGNAGTVALASPTVQGGGFSNSGSVWTVTALIGLTCILESEL